MFLTEELNRRLSEITTIHSLEELEHKTGEVHAARLPIGSLPDCTEFSIPVLVGEGSEPGPTLLLTALIHGVEIGGYDVIRRLIREEIDFKKVRGRVVAVPIVNPFALAVSNRFTPQDSADLNRVFPGSANGTLSHRIAHTLVEKIVKHADYVVDYHSCNPPSCVFTIVDAEGSAEVQEKSMGMAQAFGAITVAPSDKTQGTFSGYLSSVGKPVITPELVFSRRFDQLSSDAGVIGTLNVMKYLGMIDGQPQELLGTPPFKRGLRYTALFAKTGGFIYFSKKVTDHVEKDEVIATIRNPWGEVVEEVRAPVTGMIIAYPMAGNQALTTGDKIAYFTSDF
ncbi:hypothetical protein CVD25_05595 [Bacillus canaveralius]|uniref:Succinylglutamate desuccinylase/Aspartoacylase catalytic domain-containing protein n=1 Tax=Bacillus canaveralius TaxID=1403243 RepID=A0A2N5GL45_9BACI|nr:hypothetical protein CU635_12115 [Bacillus canaveralius]PLR99474.1 hypothetical protein CVD25_05595 [Bacillus canaveralius]RSK49089.1 hypothetical protein EJA13_16115 [Bacillus canaveralius]